MNPLAQAKRSEVFHFTWPRPSSGFEWVDATLHPEQRDPAIHPSHHIGVIRTDGSESRWLVPVDASEEIVEEWHPLLEETGLFRTFAETEPTEPAIQAFASAHGWLGVDRLIKWHGRERRAAHGEPFWVWAHEIRAMRAVVDLMRAIKDQDEKTLSQWISRGDPSPGLAGDQIELSMDVYGKRVRIRLGTSMTDYIGSGHSRLRQLDLLGIARLFALQIANDESGDYIRERLLWDDATNKPVRKLQPKNLVGAMWHQCFRFIADEVDWRICKNCQKWFEVSTRQQGKRADATFHSENCRIAYHQRRRRHAQRLALKLQAEGLPIGEIAKRVGRDSSVVSKWIKKAEVK